MPEVETKGPGGKGRCEVKPHPAFWGAGVQVLEGQQVRPRNKLVPVKRHAMHLNVVGLLISQRRWSLLGG